MAHADQTRPASRLNDDSRTGKDLRAEFPRSRQSELVLPERRDPVGVICRQNRTRLKDLLGIRTERLSESAFSYFRGTAAQMAIDLAAGPDLGPSVLSSADAHLGNFGFFASPERSLIFDLNDFDEAEFAPFDWDVKRLATSAHLSAQTHGLSDEAGHAAAFAAVKGYQEALSRLMSMRAIDRFYAIVDSDSLLERIGESAGRTSTEKAMRKARSRTGEKALKKFTTVDSGTGMRLVDQPPLTRHVDRPDVDVEAVLGQYLESARADVRMLLEPFAVADWVLRVVGVGSVGTSCFMVLLTGPSDEKILLQVKEAGESVVSAFGGRIRFAERTGTRRMAEGERVVRAQQVLQSASDPFLGWSSVDGRDYYWRQFRDMKGSYDLASLDAEELREYSRVCGAVLARAHSQSPGAQVVADYLGSSDSFAIAITQWSHSYAEVVVADHALLVAAAASGERPELGASVG